MSVNILWKSYYELGRFPFLFLFLMLICIKKTEFSVISATISLCWLQHIHIKLTKRGHLNTCQHGHPQSFCLEAMSFIEFSSGKKIIDQVIVYVRWGDNGIDSWLKGWETTWNEIEIQIEILTFSRNKKWASSGCQPSRQVFSKQAVPNSPSPSLPSWKAQPPQESLGKFQFVFLLSPFKRLLFFFLQNPYLLLM